MSNLTPNQLALMSAILGVSNLGKDDLFNKTSGRESPIYTVECLKERYGVPRHPLDVEHVAMDFCSSFAENEEMAEMFVDEARSWMETLRIMKVEKIKATWPNYAAFVDCTK